MFRRIALAIFTLSIGVHCYAQRDPERGWTDKNNAEEYAAYLIRIAYSELGYLGARVQVRENGTRRIFEVERGRVYHIKAVRILGSNDLPAEAMTAAPTVGDVYCNARINGWVDTLRSRYKKDASWGMRVDHANASVTIEVGLDAESIPHPK
jgi:outer membrane protein assembly factor BamA